MTVLKYVWRAFATVCLWYWAFTATTLLWPLSSIASVMTGAAFVIAFLEIVEQWLRSEA